MSSCFAGSSEVDGRLMVGENTVTLLDVALLSSEVLD